MAIGQGAVESLVVNAAFWRNRKVLLTGHTGFKGSWLSLWLQQLGAQVTGLGLPPPSSPNMFEIANVAEGMTSIMGDIRNCEALTQAASEAGPEVIIHMAAQSLVRRSYIDPVETFSTNVMGTVHLLEACRHISSVRAVLIITSDKCYDNKEWVWGYRESEPMGGFDPYSSSKGCAELLTTAYRNSFFHPDRHDRHGVAMASARAGNVIGGGDWAEDRLIPDVFRAIGAGRPVVIRNPHAVRPWQHVLEPLNGYLQLAQKLYETGTAYAEGWNFGPDDEDAKPVHWIVERLVQLWGGDASWQRDEGDHPHEAHYLKLDCSKAKTRLHWRPLWSLPLALEEIVAWQRAYLAQQNMRAFSLDQIRRFNLAENV